MANIVKELASSDKYIFALKFTNKLFENLPQLKIDDYIQIKNIDAENIILHTLNNITWFKNIDIKNVISQTMNEIIHITEFKYNDIEDIIILIYNMIWLRSTCELLLLHSIVHHVTQINNKCMSS
jgi:hypothetical protein